ncbi:MAG: Na-translocating system protein MpsB [Actinomycetota bacterium]|nr:Na-translocating system protein MpsB [Actinomycetota bacterium]
MTSQSAGADLRALVDEAARPVPLLWPLTTMVAANPLWDLRHLTFTAAVQVAGHSLPIRGYPPAALLAQALAEGRITPADLVMALDRSGRPAAGPVFPATGEDDTDGAIRPNATVLESRDQRQGSDLAGHADREVSRWCAAFLARLMPTPDGRADPVVDGFYPAWRMVAGADPVIRSLGMRPLLDRLGPDPEQAVATCLDLLGRGGEERLRELTGQFTRQPGWAAYAKWRSRWAVPDHPAPRLDLMDYLAVRLAYDVGLGTQPARSRRRPAATARPALRPSVLGPSVLGPSVPDPTVPDPTAAIADEGIRARLAHLPAAAAAEVWLTAYENHYRDRLLSALSEAAAGPVVAEPAAQVVCCIDVRSEGLRRHLERLGDYQTFGFAGFFGIPARLRPYGGGEPADLYPVLLSSALEVGQQPADPAQAGRTLAAAADAAAAATALGAARKKPVPGYLLAEAGGLALGPLSMLRTVSPRGFAALRRAVTSLTAPEPTVLHRLSGPGAPADGEQAGYAETALRAMGLTDGFAPVVVLCGHGSSTENNPYASALDCGACGAARGGASARLAAAVLNRDPVRAALARRGIVIPDDTVFVAAEHDTATDLVTVFPPEQRTLNAGQDQRIAAVAADLTRAGAELAAERVADLPGASLPGASLPGASLPGASRARRLPGGRRGDRTGRPGRDGRGPARRHVATRAADWAQVQPEWGLARNAAIIIGPRRLTVRADLGRRAFLHSYEPGADPDGGLLEAILAGPMIVAHWISACYYFSTVDPDVLGAGDKVAHNVVGGLAVWQGAGGDLRVGLPRQSVFDRDRAYHEPMRLLVLIEAPLSRIDQVITRNRDVADLVAGEWVRLAARHAGRFWVRDGGDDWRPWRPADESATTGPAVTAAR